MIRVKKFRIISVLAFISAVCAFLGWHNISFVTKADERLLTTIYCSNSASVINFGAPADLSAGETITLETEVKSAKFNGTGSENFGFVVSDRAGNSNTYAVGEKSSFIFGRQTQRLGIIWVNSEDTTYTNMDTDPPVVIGGQKRMDYGYLFSTGNCVKVEYKAASSETAKDGSWKVLYKTSNDNDYSEYCTFSGLGYYDAPYGQVYFGINSQLPCELELYDLTVKTGGNADITLRGGTNATVSTKEVVDGESGDDEELTEVGDVYYRDEITFVGVGGTYESVQLYAETEV